MIPPPISPLSDYTEKRVPGGTFEHESWELYTQSAGPGIDGDVDDDLADIHESHHRQIKHYKTLLIRAQSASAASIHELHTKLTDLEGRYDRLTKDHKACSAAESGSTAIERAGRERVDLANVKGMMRNMGNKERLEVLSAVLEGCHPSDISTQIAILQKYRRSRFDILGSLPEALATEVMKHLDLTDILSLRRISKGYSDLTRTPGVWRYRCIQLDGPTHPATHVQKDTQDSEELDRSWEDLYHQLHLREINWSSATSTSVSVISAHTNYITSLCIHRDTLISGSYDESIRIWHLPPLQPSVPAQLTLSQTIPAKAVSCLAYRPSARTLVAGYHDNGRIQIWRKVGQEWISHRLLHGHLHVIRAVAINAKWAVTAGADKAIVIWDWRTGEKYLKLGQQTNICVGLQLMGDTVITMTVDGVIRAFSITRREIVVQYKLWNLIKGQDKPAAGAEGMISWFDAKDLDMACGTKDGIYRLQWQSRMASAPKSDASPSPALLSSKTSSSIIRTPIADAGGKQSAITSPIASPRSGTAPPSSHP